MRTFAFWYVVFFFGGTVGALAGSNFGESGGLMLGLLGGMALVAWAAYLFLPQQPNSGVSPVPILGKHSIGEPEQTASQDQQPELVRLVSVHEKTVRPAVVLEFMPSTLRPLTLPRGIFDFALRKRLKDQGEIEYSRVLAASAVFGNKDNSDHDPNQLGAPGNEARRPLNTGSVTSAN
jgi:hypothetical protein